MVGKNSREGFDIFSQPTSHLPRVFEAYKFAYKKYVPPRPNLVSTCRPAAPQCGHSGLTEQSMLMLASSNFEDPDAKEWGMVSIRSSGHLKMGIGQSSVKDAFQSLLDLQSKQHRSKVLVLDDAAFLTSAFWDERNPAFSRADGVNYLNAGLKTSQKLVREATGGIQCTECKLGLPGFPAEVFSHASAFDRCATDEQKKALFQLQSQGIAPKVQMGSLAHPECLQELEQLLEESSVLLVNSGNVDFLGYVYKTFALTAAPRVELLQMLLMGDMQGLGLAGHCALRPHWSNKTRLWDITSSLYANAVGGIDIVGLQDGDVLTSGCDDPGLRRPAWFPSGTHRQCHGVELWLRSCRPCRSSFFKNTAEEDTHTCLDRRPPGERSDRLISAFEHVNVEILEDKKARRRHFASSWLFNFMVVFATLANTVLIGCLSMKESKKRLKVVSLAKTDGSGLRWAASLRVFRSLRIARAIRREKVVRGLFRITQGFIDALPSMLWTFLAAVLFAYMLAIVLTALVGSDLAARELWENAEEYDQDYNGELDFWEFRKVLRTPGMTKKLSFLGVGPDEAESLPLGAVAV
eukprot:g10977.t1